WQRMYLSVDNATGRSTLNLITVAHDCGLIINPDGPTNQIEGNVVQSASHAILEHPDQPAWGAGAISTLTTRPAIANAIFPATGQRLRRIPLNPGQGARQGGGEDAPAFALFSDQLLLLQR